MIKKLTVIVVTLLGSLSSLYSQDKFYIDYDSLNTSEDAFHIHIGQNVWLQTNVVYKDEKGFYALENNLFRLGYNTEVERKWKCPYCYNYWPLGKACSNKDCPSKFK